MFSLMEMLSSSSKTDNKIVDEIFARASKNLREEIEVNRKIEDEMPLIVTLFSMKYNGSKPFTSIPEQVAESLLRSAWRQRNWDDSIQGKDIKEWAEKAERWAKTKEAADSFKTGKIPDSF